MLQFLIRPNIHQIVSLWILRSYLNKCNQKTDSKVEIMGVIGVSLISAVLLALLPVWEKFFPSMDPWLALTASRPVFAIPFFLKLVCGWSNNILNIPPPFSKWWGLRAYKYLVLYTFGEHILSYENIFVSEVFVDYLIWVISEYITLGRKKIGTDFWVSNVPICVSNLDISPFVSLIYMFFQTINIMFPVE